MSDKHFYNIDLKFIKTEVLTQVMLDELYEFPRSFANIKYNNYGDGVLFGADIENRDGDVFITKSVVKYKGLFYRLDDDYNLSEYIRIIKANNEIQTSTDYKVVLVLSESMAIDNRNSQVRTFLDIRVYPINEEVQGVCLVSFKIAMGDSLDLPNYPDVENLDYKHVLNYIECSSFNMLLMPYSLPNATTFHPSIFRIIKNALIQKKNKGIFEYSIINQIATNEVLDIDFMKAIFYDYADEDVLEQNISGTNNIIILKEFVKIILENNFNYITQYKEVVKESEESIDTNLLGGL